jgi:hypothetical protein
MKRGIYNRSRHEERITYSQGKYIVAGIVLAIGNESNQARAIGVRREMKSEAGGAHTAARDLERRGDNVASDRNQSGEKESGSGKSHYLLSLNSDSCNFLQDLEGFGA